MAGIQFRIERTPLRVVTTNPMCAQNDRRRRRRPDASSLKGDRADQSPSREEPRTAAGCLLITFREGRYVLGILGIFLPFLWLIGAVLPDRGGGMTASM